MALHPVVLCGGSGTRLWPASRQGRPKQFLPLIGPNSSFQETLLRLRGLAAETPLIVTGAEMTEAAWAQASAIGVEPVLLVEPSPRNSGPAAAAAAAFVRDLDPEGIVLLLAADHHIGQPEKFVAATQLAARAARGGRIVTFGIKPTHPASGYGYIKPGPASGEGVFAVESFVEKPDAETAAGYIREGRLWNSGNFCFRADVLLEEMAAFEPAIYEAALASVRAASREAALVHLDPAAFEAAPARSIDHAVMERTQRAAVVPGDFSWSDLGAWSAIREASATDADGNVVAGEAVLREVRGSLVRTDGPIVTAIGVENLAIIVDGEAVLVCPLDRAEEVKALVEGLAPERR
ncbi:MAG TPA: sugar phosphate nucleotidyltransferase [Caulobacteraceae bacterium]|nr:sugar phosphate nucleotidyltransferase [Caulobacteraceae bacterium]